MGVFQTDHPHAGMIAKLIHATAGVGLLAVPVRVETDRIARLAAGARPRLPRTPPRPPTEAAPPRPRRQDRPVAAEELTATIIRMGVFQTDHPHAGMIAKLIRATMGPGVQAVPVRVETHRIARPAAGAPPRLPRPPPRPPAAAAPPPRPPAVTLAAAAQTTVEM